MKNAQTLLLVALVGSLAACSGGDQTEDAAPAVVESAPAAATATVSILEPTADVAVMGTSVTVRLSASGVEIRPAGELVDGTGHHHLYLDADLGDATVPVPSVPGSIIHMGDGSSEYIFEGVGPGQHRLIAVVADGLHVPLQPLVTDTVTFTVN